MQGKAIISKHYLDHDIFIQKEITKHYAERICSMK